MAYSFSQLGEIRLEDLLWVDILGTRYGFMKWAACMSSIGSANESNDLLI
jgi:hypothetical protein